MEDKNKNLIEKIKEKFSRIFKKGEPSPKKPEILNIIYEEIKNSKEPIKISDIAKNTKIKDSTIRRYIRNYLQDKEYVKKSRVYTPPFLMVISNEKSKDADTKPEFIYGKEKRDKKIEAEKEVLNGGINLLNKNEQESLKVILKIKEYNSMFIKSWNEIVEKLWIQKEFSAKKLKIASGANRYKI
jgi:hypothetical protein